MCFAGWVRILSVDTDGGVWSGASRRYYGAAHHTIHLAQRRS